MHVNDGRGSYNNRPRTRASLAHRFTARTDFRSLDTRDLLLDSLPYLGLTVSKGRSEATSINAQHYSSQPQGLLISVDCLQLLSRECRVETISTKLSASPTTHT